MKNIANYVLDIKGFSKAGVGVEWGVRGGRKRNSFLLSILLIGLGSLKSQSANVCVSCINILLSYVTALFRPPDITIANYSQICCQCTYSLT